MAGGDSWSADLAAHLGDSIERGDLWLPLVVGAVGGLLTSFTPCVYPLIPITVRYFGGLKTDSRAKVIRLAFVYILGMMVFYSTLGTSFAASNAVFGSFLASPWVLGAVAVFCAAMGVSMLGAFSLQLPVGLNTKLSQVGGQSVGGALGMGLVSGLIAAPCTGPVLAVILTLIAKTGEVLFGFWLMVAFSFGLGLPFLVLAIFSGSLQALPKAGPWMEAVKGILAVAMFVVAAYFLHIALPSLGRLIQSVPQPGWVGLVCVLVGSIAAVAYLRAYHKSPPMALKLSGVLLLTVGITVALFGDAPATAAGTDAQIHWQTAHDKGVAAARTEGQPMMIDFTADWCVACKELEHKTFSAPAVIAESQRFVALRLDATEMTDAMEAIFEKYGVLGLPTVVFVDSSGNVLKDPRVTGFVPPERFTGHMTAVK